MLTGPYSDRAYVVPELSASEVTRLLSLGDAFCGIFSVVCEKRIGSAPRLSSRLLE